MSIRLDERRYAEELKRLVAVDDCQQAVESTALWR